MTPEPVTSLKTSLNRAKFRFVCGVKMLGSFQRIEKLKMLASSNISIIMCVTNTGSNDINFGREDYFE